MPHASKHGATHMDNLGQQQAVGMESPTGDGWGYDIAGIFQVALSPYRSQEKAYAVKPKG